MPSSFSAIRTALLAFGAALTLAGCTMYAAVGPGDFAAENRLVVTPDRQWSRLQDMQTKIWQESWTLNGPLLDSLYIAAGIEGGRPLVNASAEQSRDLPRFRPGMTPSDVVALVQGTLTRTLRGADFVDLGVAPARIAEQDGIRFEFKFGAGGGGAVETDRHAVGYAFELDRRLYLILYHAAEIHFFDTGRPAAEAVIRSARLAPGRG